MIPSSDKRLPLAVTLVSRVPQMQGMEYDMSYDTRGMAAPNVPPPVRRRSLGQTTLIHRYQFSRYLSRFRVLFRPDYPVFHGFTITRTAAPGTINAPAVAAAPGVGNQAAVTRQGRMAGPPRWKAALPSKVTPFNPPVFDTQSGG